MHRLKASALALKNLHPSNFRISRRFDDRPGRVARSPKAKTATPRRKQLLAIIPAGASRLITIGNQPTACGN
jgi:hypothetical protein